MSASTPPPRADFTVAALRAEAELGHPQSLFDLARALVARKEFDEVLDLYRRGAQGNHVGCQIEYARLLMWGLGCDPAPAQAVEWLERAEAQGEAVGGYYLALMALGSVVLPRDGKINERMLAAAKADFPPALLATAVHLGRRDNREDQTRCLQLLGRATNLGDPVAAQLLVERLVRGEGCDVQPRAARQLRAQLAAHGLPSLPSIVAGIPPLRLPLRESGLPEPGMLAFEDVLQPAPMQTLCDSPHVMQIDQLLSADECRLLVAYAQPMLQRSRTIAPESGQAIEMDLRTSADASFDPMMEDFALRMVQLRMARSARMELPHPGQLSVRRYRPGGQYKPHRDYRPVSSLLQDRPGAGNRARTICVYLNNVDAGGETEFPLAGVRVSPQAGRAVVFDNLLPDGAPDPQSLHAGLPVQRGEKWLATLWLRQKRYRQY